MPQIIRQVLIGLGVILLQWLVFNHLRLWGTFADVVLIYVAFVAVRYGRMAGAVAGFTAGLLMDILTPGTPLGLFMLLKTLLGFGMGFFKSEQGEHVRFYPMASFFGALFFTIVHNGLMVIILALDNQTRTLFLITGLWFGSSVYTAFVALMASLYRPR